MVWRAQKASVASPSTGVSVGARLAVLHDRGQHFRISFPLDKGANRPPFEPSHHMPMEPAACRQDPLDPYHLLELQGHTVLGTCMLCNVLLNPGEPAICPP